MVTTRNRCAHEAKQDKLCHTSKTSQTTPHTLCSHFGSISSVQPQPPGRLVGMGKKAVAPRLVKSCVKAFAGFAEKKASREDLDVVASVHAWLVEHPEQAKPCLWSLQAGAFSAEALAKKADDIPPSRTHLNLLSYKFLKKTLNKLDPVKCSDLVLRMVEANNGLNLLKMFCFATSSRPADLVFTHDATIFWETYKKIHVLLGRRLRLCLITDEGEVSFENCLFKIVENEDDSGYQYKLMHICGKAVQASIKTMC